MADAAKSGIGDIRCHQMSPDVRIITENQAVILLFKSGHWNKIWSEKNLFLCKRCVAIRIYEDSLFKRTEQVVSLSDKKSFVRQKPTCRLKPGIFLQSRKIQSKEVLMWTWKIERKDYKWTRRIDRGIYNAYPLYDWKVSDIWLPMASWGGTTTGCMICTIGPVCH